METKKKALGKGLEQLFSDAIIDFDNFEEKITEESKKDVEEILIDEIRSNPYQPRKTFDIDSLNELADSIKVYGVVQPIIVKRSIRGYDLIAGERRTKAAKIAGLTKVPAIIKDFDDQEMMEIALIENIQREDLNPIEEAMSINNIIKLHNYTQEEFAKKFGKSRSYVTNLLGLLKLPDDVKDLVENKKISMSHARVLSKMNDEKKIKDLANDIVSKNVSVHELEEIAKNEINKVPTTNIKPSNFNAKNKLYENMLIEKLNTKIKVCNNKIEIYYNGREDLDRILELMNINNEDE